MLKPNVSATPAPDLITVRAVHTINDGRASRVPGTVFEVSPKDAELLLKAGAVVLATDVSVVPIEEMLPDGMDSKVWRADPRLIVNGQRPACFVKCADFDDAFPRAARR